MASTGMAQTAEPMPGELDRIVAKVSRRLVWFLFAAFVVGFIDRVNVGFAALTMNQDLGLTATQFGAANSIFYIGYILFELPSNLALARFGARIWIPRIMITWGIMACLTAAATGPLSLYGLRFLVGVGEAGLFPGVLLYLTFWIPTRNRARVTAAFLVGQPFAIAVGSVLSAVILRLEGVSGLTGWQWLFIIEGAPSVVLGVAAWFILPNKPSAARWLTPAEAMLLETALAAEHAGATPPGRKTRGLLGELTRPVVLTLGLIYFCLVTTLNAISTWLPQIVRDLSAGRTATEASLLASLPAAAACGMMLWIGRASDRAGSRRLHAGLPMLLGAFGWLLAGYAPQPSLRFAGLVCTTVGAYGALGVFWAIPPGHLSPRAKPAGLALITMAGIMGSIVSPMVIGILRDMTGSFTAGLLFASSMLVCGASLVLFTPYADAGMVRRPVGAGDPAERLATRAAEPLP